MTLGDFFVSSISDMASSREQRSQIFRLLGQIDHNIKQIEAKNAEADKSNENVKKEEILDNNDDEEDTLNGFLQGYNESEQHQEGIKT